MERSKIVAIITGAISIILAIAYLILVQFLDFRGEMKPAPISQLNQPVIISYHPTSDTNRQIVSNLL
ncbi:MAG: hypothetical protein KME38_03050 [Spirirestis rafaelensis WJT71-NPBG6]|jgi:hypothetical protein|nr:hypothetical protein [Spirirestis rafaelensis WJT71-NPBG6]